MQRSSLSSEPPGKLSEGHVAGPLPGIPNPVCPGWIPNICTLFFLSSPGEAEDQITWYRAERERFAMFRSPFCNAGFPVALKQKSEAWVSCALDRGLSQACSPKGLRQQREQRLKLKLKVKQSQTRCTLSLTLLESAAQGLGRQRTLQPQRWHRLATWLGC